MESLFVCSLAVALGPYARCRVISSRVKLTSMNELASTYRIHSPSISTDSISPDPARVCSIGLFNGRFQHNSYSGFRSSWKEEAICEGCSFNCPTIQKNIKKSYERPSKELNLQIVKKRNRCRRGSFTSKYVIWRWNVPSFLTLLQKIMYPDFSQMTVYFITECDQFSFAGRGYREVRQRKRLRLARWRHGVRPPWRRRPRVYVNRHKGWLRRH